MSAAKSNCEFPQSSPLIIPRALTFQPQSQASRCNACMAALAPGGRQTRDLPADPSRVWRLLLSAPLRVKGFNAESAIRVAAILSAGRSPSAAVPSFSGCVIKIIMHLFVNCYTLLFSRGTSHSRINQCGGQSLRSSRNLQGWIEANAAITELSSQVWTVCLRAAAKKRRHSSIQCFCMLHQEHVNRNESNTCVLPARYMAYSTLGLSMLLRKVDHWGITFPDTDALSSSRRRAKQHKG
eukprot:4414021-Amphidinium_carterae.1